MLTESETKEARALGWALHEVFCLQKEKLFLVVLPEGTAFRNAEEATDAVVTQAKSRCGVAIRALSLISNYNARKPK